MIWLAALLGVVVILVLMVCLFRPHNPEPPLDPEATMQAAVELHRIRRDLDVAYLKSEQRRDGSLVEHRIIEIIDGGDEP